MTEINRPDPDSLLNLVKQDNEDKSSKRGKLKIFFGSSAGVGKTFAMLSEAMEIKKSENLDVVIGVIETHGRSETARLVEGFEHIDLKKSNYKGIDIYEFDLEASIKRKPDLILIDELAHTNAPNSIHPKRWQDVMDILDNGIDVYSTLNVQHLESLNDVIEKATGIEVKETVPDEVFDQADEIELIDTPFNELLKRLHQGKIYIAEGASKRAAENFFKKHNLIALREIALRRTAERVDAQMSIINAARGKIKGDTTIGEKILVCIGHDNFVNEIIRHSRRMANRSKSQLIGLYVETSRHFMLSNKAKLNLEDNIRFAERLGVKVARVSGNDATDEIINFAKKNGITRIVTGCRKKTFSINPFSSTLAMNLIFRSNGLEITTITEAQKKDRDLSSIKKLKPSNLKQFISSKPSEYFYSMVFVGLITILCLPFRDVVLDGDNFAMFYMIAVILSAAKYGISCAIVSSIASVFVFNFFFVKPYYSLLIHNHVHYYTLIIMLLNGFITGSLAFKLSLRVNQSRKREAEILKLYSFTRELSKTRGMENISKVCLKHVDNSFYVRSGIFMIENDKMKLFSESNLKIDAKEESVVRWVFDNNKIAGRNTDTLPSARGLYLPLVAEDFIIGVLCVMSKYNDYNFTTDEIGKLETFASIMASSLARVKKAEQAEISRVMAESEKIKIEYNITQKAIDKEAE